MNEITKDIRNMNTLQLMEYLKDNINSLKYEVLDNEEYINIAESVGVALECLNDKSELLAMPYKLSLRGL